MAVGCLRVSEPTVLSFVSSFNTSGLLSNPIGHSKYAHRVSSCVVEKGSIGPDSSFSLFISVLH
jgi:hypothetical protein